MPPGQFDKTASEILFNLQEGGAWDAIDFILNPSSQGAPKEARWLFHACCKDYPASTGEGGSLSSVRTRSDNQYVVTLRQDFTSRAAAQSQAPDQTAACFP